MPGAHPGLASAFRPGAKDGGPAGPPLPTWALPEPPSSPLLQHPPPFLGSSADSDSQPFPLPAGARSREWGGGSQLQLPPGQAAAAQGTGEAGQLPQGTRPHPCSHRSLGPLSREPEKTRPCTVILNGHLSGRERPNGNVRTSHLPRLLHTTQGPHVHVRTHTHTHTNTDRPRLETQTLPHQTHTQSPRP